MSYSERLLKNLMTPLKFYYIFGIFVESFPLVPIILGAKKWRQLTLGIKLFIGFLVAEFLLNCLTDYYHFVLHRSNLFLFYFYSFFQSTFILSAFIYFFRNRVEKIYVICLWILGVFFLISDFLFVSKINYNYLSNFCINLIIAGVALYYFITTVKVDNTKRRQQKEVQLVISAAVTLQFFVKLVNIFIEKYLLETQYNTFLTIQTRNVYAYFMLLSLIIYTYAFDKFKADEK